MSESVNHKKR